MHARCTRAHTNGAVKPDREMYVIGEEGNVEMEMWTWRGLLACWLGGRGKGGLVMVRSNEIWVEVWGLGFGYVVGNMWLLWLERDRFPVAVRYLAP